MLSRREREFLQNPEKFTGSYARWLRYSIKRKIRKTMKDLELISRTWPQALENSLTLKSLPLEKTLTSMGRVDKGGPPPLFWGERRGGPRGTPEEVPPPPWEARGAVRRRGRPRA
ncbi:hypothetical protein J7L97_04945, partial [Candidatus Bathyarchaeota archaeon]|nr:hypothetical protein [Candidatus Bathyarchaeota archaeon]